MTLIHDEDPRQTDAASEADLDGVLLRSSYPAVPDSLPVIRRNVASLAARLGSNPERLEAIHLAVSEAATNAVRHAYPVGEGSVHVIAASADGSFWVLVADDGCGIRARPESDGLGLGLVLMSELSDEFIIVERSSGGTEVRLRFELLAPSRRDKDQLRGSARPASLPAASVFSTTT